MTNTKRITLKIEITGEPGDESSRIQIRSSGQGPSANQWAAILLAIAHGVLDQTEDDAIEVSDDKYRLSVETLKEIDRP